MTMQNSDLQGDTFNVLAMKNVSSRTFPFLFSYEKDTNKMRIFFVVRKHMKQDMTASQLVPGGFTKVGASLYERKSWWV